MEGSQTGRPMMVCSEQSRRGLLDIGASVRGAFHLDACLEERMGPLSGVAREEYLNASSVAFVVIQVLLESTRSRSDGRH